ncbi:MAG: 50S ribosome-binding GTPase, partial [Opitutales bacterium]|nr:50S ribosome-binding GTPase [Opitutales bacterium]
MPSLDSSARISASKQLKRVALIGNPNTGKSTLFNCLTGLRQKVGNYSGVTVQKKTGITSIGRESIEILDLPGTYSLAAESPDERVVVEALRGEIENVDRPDMALCILDATNLKRNLFLAYQIGQLGLPMVLALNYWDSAKKRRIDIDLAELRSRLGVPVVPISASRAEGIVELKEAIAETLVSQSRLRTPDWPDSVIEALDEMRAALQRESLDQLDEAALLRRLVEGAEARLVRSGASET